LIAVYRALGGGWQIRLGEGLASPSEIQLPRIDEMPLREAAENDIQFQSVSFESTFADLMEGQAAEMKRSRQIPVVPPSDGGFPVRQL
jgi:hypothetical protein